MPTLAAPVVPVVEGVPTGPVTTVGGQQYEEVRTWRRLTSRC